MTTTKTIKIHILSDSSDPGTALNPDILLKQ